MNDFQTETSARDAAIDRVEEANSTNPIDWAIEDAKETLRSMRAIGHVTCDEIFPDIEKYGFSDGRALGAVMRKLVILECLRPTDKFRPSERAGSHNAPRRMYINRLAVMR